MPTDVERNPHRPVLPVLPSRVEELLRGLAAPLVL